MAGEATADEQPADAPPGLRRRIWRFLVRTGFTVSLGLIALAYGGALNLPRNLPGPAIIAVGFFLSILGWWLVVVVHEAGHAIAATIVGWRVTSFVALPIGIRPRPFGLAWMTRAKVHDAGGWVVAIPASSAVMARGRDAIIYAGGPLLSLSFGAVALWLGVRWSAQTPVEEIYRGVPTLGLIIGALGYQSLVIFLMTALPSTRATSRTDGDKIYAIWRRPARDPGLWAAALLNVFSKHEGRLRDTPRWLIDRARTMQPTVKGLDRWLDGLEISVALDQREVDPADARRRLDAYLTAYGDDEWRATCDAWLAVVYEDDPDRARAVAWTGPRSETGDQIALRLAVDAALAARAGDAAEVGTLIAAMRTERRRTRPLEQRYFRDAVFDDIATRIRALPASPA